MGHTGDGPPNTSNCHPQLNVRSKDLELAVMETEIANLRTELAKSQAKLLTSIITELERSKWLSGSEDWCRAVRAVKEYLRKLRRGGQDE